jgi:hypothetical protein
MDDVSVAVPLADPAAMTTGETTDRADGLLLVTVTLAPPEGAIPVRSIVSVELADPPTTLVGDA